MQAYIGSLELVSQKALNLSAISYQCPAWYRTQSHLQIIGQSMITHQQQMMQLLCTLFLTLATHHVVRPAALHTNVNSSTPGSTPATQTIAGPKAHATFVIDPISPYDESINLGADFIVNCLVRFRDQFHAQPANEEVTHTRYEFCYGLRRQPFWVMLEPYEYLQFSPFALTYGVARLVLIRLTR